MGSDRIYAIGDIHGHLDKLREQHDRIARDGGGTVVHVGDLVDRGPDSAGVLQYLIDGIGAGEPWVVLKGNHDRMMARYLEEVPRADPKLRPDYGWLTPRVGGQTTLASYGLLKGDDEDKVALEIAKSLHAKGGGVETLQSFAPDRAALTDKTYHAAARKAVPAAHLAFLSGLETVFRTEDVFIVHAGIRPGLTFEQQAEDDLIWIREPFLSDVRDHGPLIIHGHTPIDAAAHYGNRVNIDSGVAFGGPLSAIAIEGRDVFLLTDKARKPLRPEKGG